MSKYAKLENNVVVNIVEYENAPSGSDWVEVSQSTQRIILDENNNPGYEGPSIGWIYNTETGRFSDGDNTKFNTETALQKLKDSDWAVLPDVGLTPANVELWKTYRSALRAIIRNEDSGHIIWPEAPNKEYI